MPLSRAQRPLEANAIRSSLASLSLLSPPIGRKNGPLLFPSSERCVLKELRDVRNEIVYRRIDETKSSKTIRAIHFLSVDFGHSFSLKRCSILLYFLVKDDVSLYFQLRNNTFIIPPLLITFFHGGRRKPGNDTNEL